MKASEVDRVHLTSMIDSINEITGYIGRASYSDYSQREDIREQVSAQMAQIGGAAALLSDEFKEQYRDIDWDVLKGLQYGHFDMELELDAHPQWNIVSEDMPEILSKLNDISTQIYRDEVMDDNLADDTDEPDPHLIESKDEAYFNERLEALDIDKEVLDEMEDTMQRNRVGLDLDDADIDLIDDSYIDQRFTDEDLMEGSSLDDDLEERE
ncbi:MAG: hypothetical protein ICV83_25190 [Cytophagales bacterium]|nr:hypothetical protein [Cytophagales bacterium]